MSREVVVVGAGLHRYGSFPELSVPVMGPTAVRNALQDAHMRGVDIQEAY
jgi:acetyl-CoA acetyltransferase